MKKLNLATMPKIDLHCHLDGSVPLSFIAKEKGSSDINDVAEKARINNDTCANLGEYLQRFDYIKPCLRTIRQIREGTCSLLNQLKEDQIVYAEIRFSPSVLANDDLSSRDVIEAVLAGMVDGRNQTGIFCNAIVCAMRHQSLEQNLLDMQLAREYFENGVCGVDLAGNEAKYPTADFMELFSHIKRMNMPFTIHAGECGDVQSIKAAIDFGAARIGHGIAMQGNKPIQEICAKQKIGIEMCPISNLQTKAVASDQVYPIREFMKNSLCVTVNTDNRTISNTSCRREFEYLINNKLLDEDEVLNVVKNAIECSFASDSLKNELFNKLKEYSENEEVQPQ